MEIPCTWVTEIELVLWSEDERQELERFTVSGRSSEIAIPRVGDVMNLITKDEVEQKAKFVRVSFTGHTLIRRTNPAIWRQGWLVDARIQSAKNTW